ncbi:MAG: hypothetical protein PHD03_00250 [Bacilli bacterium]|nr:hypothetical protein [Bacilli bacterium]MDD4406667.1 hypothetical protein [Bacilli bacterium]
MDKKSTNKFKIIFYILLLSFCFVYFSGKTGYYETNLQKNTLLTSDAIKEFEKDVAEGKAVNIKDYIKADVNDYHNSYSNLGFYISKSIDTILTDGVSKITSILKTLFTGE